MVFSSSTRTKIFMHENFMGEDEIFTVKNEIFMHNNEIFMHNNEIFIHETEHFCPKYFIVENSMHEVVYSPTTHDNFWGENIMQVAEFSFSCI